MPLAPDEGRTIDLDRAKLRAIAGTAYRGGRDKPLAESEISVGCIGEQKYGSRSLAPARVRTGAGGRFGPILVDARASRLQVSTGAGDRWPSEVDVELPAGEGGAVIKVVFPMTGAVAGTILRDGRALDTPIIIKMWRGRRPPTNEEDALAGLLPGATTTVPAGESEWHIDDVEPGDYLVLGLGTGLPAIPYARTRVYPGKTSVARIDVTESAAGSVSETPRE
jgi:hypothetical protein